MGEIKPCLAANETVPIADKTQVVEIDGCQVTIHYAESGNSSVLPHISKTLLEAVARKRPDDNLQDS